MEHVSRYLAQLGDASIEQGHRVRFFSLSLSGLAFTWYASLSTNSITEWDDLEKKFYAHFFIGIREKKLTDLTSMKMQSNETSLDFIMRFRNTRSMCFTLNLPDSQLVDLAIQGMLPSLREKLKSHYFENLGVLAQRVSALSNQW